MSERDQNLDDSSLLFVQVLLPPTSGLWIYNPGISNHIIIAFSTISGTLFCSHETNLPSPAPPLIPTIWWASESHSLDSSHQTLKEM